MPLNLKKCKVMHLGPNNPKVKYNIADGKTNIRHDLEETNSERDLGVILSNDGKWHTQVSKVASKANSILGMLLKTFQYKDARLVKELYCAFVRPHLEFAVSAWNPFLKEDIKILEKVQRRATRAIPQLKGKIYEERLELLEMTTLEDRRIRGDLIQQFNIMTGKDKIRWFRPPEMVQRGAGMTTRGNNLKYMREITRGNIRHNFFNNRVAPIWNRLPNHVTSAPYVNSFKARLDDYFKKTAVTV